MLRQLVIAFTLALSAGFSPTVTSVRSQHSSASIVMSESVPPPSRRAALSAAAGVAALALPLSAYADSIEEIAARSNAAAKAAKESAVDEPEQDNKSSLGLIAAIAGGGTLASTAFYTQNLKRLGEKVASGGTHNCSCPCHVTMANANALSHAAQARKVASTTEAFTVLICVGIPIH